MQRMGIRASKQRGGVEGMLRLRQSLFLSSQFLCFTCTFKATNYLFYSAHNKRKNPISPFTSSSLISKTYSFCALHSTDFSTFYQAFDKMPQRNQQCNSSDIYFVLDLLKSSKARLDVVSVVTIHCLALKRGFLAHLPTSTSLLAAYSNVSYFESSLALFYETCNKDVVTWNAMITACVENRCVVMGLHFFGEMVEEGIRFDSTTLLIVVSALTQMNCLKQGRVAHCLSIKAGMIADSSLCNVFVNMYAKCGDLNSSECTFSGMHCADTVSWNTIMSGCLHNNYPEKCLLYFREMGWSGEQVDNVSLSSAVAASACLGELSYGKVIHALGIKLGYEDSPYVSVTNSLISMYSQCGDIEAAERAFWGMTCKDVVSWNALIDGFALNGKFEEAFDLLHEMQLMRSVEPDIATVVTLISRCADSLLLREGKSVHGYAIRRLLGYDLLMMNSLMDFYSKSNSLSKAELLFNAIAPMNDLVSWNSMISGYSQNSHSEKAQRLFKEMLYLCSQFSFSTLLAILPSCNSPESLEFGKSIHCWQLKLGFSNNTIGVNALMHMYINCGDLVAAFSLLQRISHNSDTSCWNIVIVACTQNGHFQEAIKTFKSMTQQQNASPDSVTLVNVISACGNLELAFEGKSLHGLALKSLMGLDTRVQNALITMYGRCRDIKSASTVFESCYNCNLCTWNCMISAFSQNKAEVRALELFRHLEFEPNEISIVSILSACTQLGVLRHGKQIHGHVFHLGFQENSFISSALLDMYSNCGRLDIACQIFKNSKDKSNAAWSSMISAYGYHGKGWEAIELFHEMCNSGIRPTKSSVISLLSACSHSGLVDEGLRYYNNMLEEYDVRPETEHHVCIVDMLGRSGKLQEAYEFIKNLPIQPKPGVWGAMLSACSHHGDTKMGKQVAELLFKLEPENVGYYISLSNMYVTLGRWKDAVEIREIIEEKKLRKTAGYSLIDVGFG